MDAKMLLVRLMKATGAPFYLLDEDTLMTAARAAPGRRGLGWLTKA
jgi:hypothetical protein